MNYDLNEIKYLSITVYIFRVSWNSTQRIETVTEENQQNGRPIISLSCTQLQILRKLALLKLTAHIEKYCPSHRTGWNWELPKFIKKIRTPTYKGWHF